jgi:guanosine-3',5'-bis(diphosphate) 3'-pyrophosphohydrolase
MAIKGPLWQEAAAFAARAHKHQIRKDHVTPYISHPMRVALTVALLFGFDDEKILAAALLHDTIEDTSSDYDDLHSEFGKEVADIVATLSKDKRMIEPAREKAYDRQLADGQWQARLIKLADVYDNLQDCTTPAERRKQLTRVERALKLTANDPQLKQARLILERFAKSRRT